jgi:hypothetical protein
VTTLNAAELSLLARIAANPKLARREKVRTFKTLRGPAKGVARALAGETKNVSEEATETARAVKRWTSRQK